MGDNAAAREHAERALAQATNPRQPLALLAAHRLLGELDVVTGRHAAAARHLAAALTLAEACAAPYERALTHLALAELHIVEHRPEAAQGRLHQAHQLLAPLGATPALAHGEALGQRLAATAQLSAATLPFGLSAREAEVLRLLAQGLTDPQIARRLYINRNTVNAHLRGIYGKLGVNTRTAAARLAAEHNLA